MSGERILAAKRPFAHFTCEGSKSSIWLNYGSAKPPLLSEHMYPYDFVHASVSLALVRFFRKLETVTYGQMFRLRICILAIATCQFSCVTGRILYCRILCGRHRV